MVIVSMAMSYSEADKLLNWQREAKRQREGGVIIPIEIQELHGRDWCEAAGALEALLDCRIEQQEIG